MFNYMRLAIQKAWMSKSFLLSESKEPVIFYVAPDGDDRWSGRLAEPNQDKTDGPFATITRARDAIRGLKEREGGLKNPVMVMIRGGVYWLNEPIIFTAQDSGTKEYPVAYQAYKNERPVLSGGRLIKGWRQVDVDGRKLWMAEIPEVKAGRWYFRQLWVDGRRCIRARHPNKGYLSVAEVPGVTPQTQWFEGQTCFRFHQGDLKAWSTVAEGEVVVMNRWVESRLPILSVEEKERLVAFGKRSVFRLEAGDLYYVEHAYELLDAPGEWFLDRRNGALYYLPRPEEDMSSAEAIAPMLTYLVRFEGKPEEGRFVQHLVFRGLTFAHNEWYFPEEFQAPWPKPDVGGFPQAAVGVPGAVYGVGVHRIVFESCSFGRLGTYAIELSRGCCDNIIVGCELFDLGAGSIKIGEQSIRYNELEQTYGNEVSDCHIHDGGLVFHSAVGVWIGQSYNNRIIHNHVHDFYYTGVSIGWTWGYGPTLAKGNVMEFNHVHHIGVRSNSDGPILSDMGCVYTLGTQPGTVIRFNLFHDVAGFRYGGWGIYFDEGSSQIVAESNIVYRTTHGGFHQHYGRENMVHNNIFALGRDAQIQRTRREQHISFRFERNIVYWREGNLLMGDFEDLNFVFDHNLYWREGGGDVWFELRWGGGKVSWGEWRDKGMDENSLIVDPLFVAPEKDDFRLKPTSPAFKLSFKPIDTKHIGPRLASSTDRLSKSF